MSASHAAADGRAAARRVLLQIARCPSGNPLAPPSARCSAVFGAQSTSEPAHFHAPEPWRGDLLEAPLLFVSSNPSWSELDDCPRATASDDALIAYYESFDTRRFPDIAVDGDSQHVLFWHALHYHAAWLLERGPGDVIAGKDFCITELVHCKSKNGTGVKAAGPTCRDRHFDALMQCAGAQVVVVLGNKAAELLEVDRTRRAVVRELGRQRRVLLWLPHPSARQGGMRTFASYPRDELAVAQGALRAARARP
jgi:hypothetical protein